MACLSLYKCPHCGFEIMTAPRFYYPIMSGYHITRKCSNCREIIREHFGFMDLPHFHEPEEFFEWVVNNQFVVKHGRCPVCKEHSVLTLWSPTTNRCPKCRHMLVLKEKEIMYVD